jgi:imidazoleglycerol-phosphate dehydratase
VDFSGRCFLDYRVAPPTEKVGTFDTELGEEFWYGFVRNAECAMHFQKLAGKNSHHILEGSFKSMARSLRQAVSIDAGFANEIPSTKGVL